MPLAASPPAFWRVRRRPLTAGLLILALALAGGLAVHLIRINGDHSMSGLPHVYEYSRSAPNADIELHLLSLPAEQIVLRADRLPLKEVQAYGINGGFFYESSLLSIAIMNDTPVNGNRGAYGSGWFNAKYPRGTLVYDAAAKRFSVQVVSSGGELRVTDLSRYWAQGGVSMNLHDDQGWAQAAAAEHLPFAEERRLRSGMAYDAAGSVWLIVTPAKCTAAEFRAAVQAQLAGKGAEGIFLDGDGSSQMNTAEITLPGDSRPVVQMVAVRQD